MNICSKKIYGFILLVIGLLIFTGCSKDGNKNSSSATSDELIIALASDIESFDVHNNNNTVSEAVVVNLFDYLIRTDG